MISKSPNDQATLPDRTADVFAERWPLDDEKRADADRLASLQGDAFDAKQPN